LNIFLLTFENNTGIVVRLHIECINFNESKHNNSTIAMSYKFADFNLSLLQLRYQMKKTVTPMLKRYKLSMETWLILECLSRENNGVSLSELAELQRANNISCLSKYVDKLSENGLVERHTLPHDQRFVEIKISPAGRELLEEIDKALHPVAERIDKIIPKTAQSNLIEITRGSLISSV
jgi:DNA-binding MarR family transcriptional regulator